jgi:hypothetical protein
MKTEAPPGLKSGHRELHEELERAAQAGGKTGAAAQQVLRTLHPHILLEEEFAMPPLGLLRRLAAGEVTPDMAGILRTTDTLKAELPRMLDEHRLIVDALTKLMQAATSEQQTGYARFAQKLILHAQMEEEVLYPAAILVGEYIKAKLGRE